MFPHRPLNTAGCGGQALPDSQAEPDLQDNKGVLGLSVGRGAGKRRIAV